MDTNEKLIVGLYSLANICVGMVLLTFFTNIFSSVGDPTFAGCVVLFFLIPFAGLIIWRLYEPVWGGLEVFFGISRFIMVISWPLSSLVILFMLFYGGIKEKRTTERFEDPANGVVLNDTYVTSAGFSSDAWRVNNYYFENPSTNKREKVGVSYGKSGMLKHAENVRLIKSDDKLEFIIGSFTARRTVRKGRPEWISWSVKNSDALWFLRRFYPPLPSLDHGVFIEGQGWWDFRLPNSGLEDCVIDTLDQANNILRATCYYYQSYPLFKSQQLKIVYNRNEYPSSWNIDQEASLKLNHSESQIPFPENLVVELVIYRIIDLFERRPEYEDYQTIKNLSGSTEIFNAKLPLDSHTVRTVEISHPPTREMPLRRSYHFVGAWGDPNPNRAVFYWMKFSGDFSNLRSQEIGRFFRLEHFQRENCSYMIFLKIARGDRS